jgi:hypothetical protein
MLEMKKHLEPFISIQVTATVAEALALLRNKIYTFALVYDAKSPQALLRESHLVSLVGKENHALSQVLDHFPALLMIDEDDEGLNAQDVKELALLLKRTSAAGLVVHRGDRVIGIVTRTTIANTLSLETIPYISSERANELPGNIGVPPRTFICRKCQPVRIRRPRQGGEIPQCPKHGKMDQEGV